MSEEDKKLQKHLVNEMMKVSKTNPDVMFYMQALMKKYEELEQKVEQLENIIKEAIDYIQNNLLFTEEYDYDEEENLIWNGAYDDKEREDLLNILNKASE